MTPRKDNPVTVTEAPEKETAAQKAHADLQAALKRLRTEEGWQAWLVSKSKLYRHSAMNQMLIWSQFPEASICRGRVQWQQDFNRSLIRDAHAIWIRAPRTKKLAEIDPATGEQKKRTYFKNVRVFDVSQTSPIEGLDEIPVEPPREPVTGESHRPWILPLTRLAKDNGFKVSFRELPAFGPSGWFNAEQRLIVVSAGESANAQVRIMVHELCHAFGYTSYEEGRGRTEACTEAAAFIACSMIGLDVSGESVPYIAGWADDAEEVIEADLKKIDQIARKVATAKDDE
jgi:hypothetical protein